DREHLDPDPAPARDPEMAELVHENQDGQDDQKADQVVRQTAQKFHQLQSIRRLRERPREDYHSRAVLPMVTGRRLRGVTLRRFYAWPTLVVERPAAIAVAIRRASSSMPRSSARLPGAAAGSFASVS